MYNKIIIVLISFFLCSILFNCSNKKDNQNVKVDSDYNLVKMETSSPNFTYNIFSNEDSLHIYYDSILVIDANGHNIQSISLNDKNEWGRLKISKQEEFPIYFEDYNFDGFKDLSVTRQISQMANIFSSYWLFDSKQGEFIYNDQLSSLNSPSFDSLKKEITCSYKSGVNEPVIEEIYKWANNKLVRLK
jgi:hypothetical protein